MMSPYLSFVVTSRNDEHGGDMLRRMQIFVTGLLEQCRRHNLHAELIIVEWNPPLDRPNLAQVLRWPTEPGPCTVRIIQVPPEIHRRFKYSDALPLFQMIAKNVGIRRAQSKFVLATNIDILFSDELMQFLACGELNPDRMYRIDRYDVPSDVPEEMPITAQLEWCRHHFIRVNRHRETVNVQNGVIPPPSHATISFRQKVLDWIERRDPPLHTNACGDFTLLPQAYWDQVRGYPEFEMFSFKLDGLLCYAAHYAGAQQVILKEPMRIYHIEHALGSGWSPGIGATLLDKRLERAGIPQLGRKQYNAWVERMRTEHHPVLFNVDDKWGLADEHLSETVIADWVRK